MSAGATMLFILSLVVYSEALTIESEQDLLAKSEISPLYDLTFEMLTNEITIIAISSTNFTMIKST
jgi:hypothetical protein